MKASGRFSWLLIALLGMPLMAGSAEDPGHGGGGSDDHGGGGAGCGDVFGDLVHLKRDVRTGQPIMAKRWIEFPGDVYDWGYCPIAVTADGDEIGFIELSCDAVDADAVVEVDYFGRLSGGRTKERNSRMHFDEVISSIKDAGWVSTDETGRLKLGYECAGDGETPPSCEFWSTVDSPMENMALYTRLMKYGHFQTDPMEEDIWAHGDPATMPQYHPALGPGAHGKFDEHLLHLLANGGEGGPQVCFPGYPGDSETFDPACAGNERLHYKDFYAASSYLGFAANKTGKITVDLVQYMNRILKIPLDTETTVATRDTLPTLIRVCETAEEPVPGVEPTYLEECEIIDGADDMAVPANERFVEFRRAAYRRRWRDESLYVLQDEGAGTWTEIEGLPLMQWLDYANGPMRFGARGIAAFVASSSDALRAVEFVHNYAVPDDLWLIYAPQ